MKNLEKGIEVLKILNSNSFDAFIVGGAVRDYLLGYDSNDIDITTNATYEDICRIFDNVINEGQKYLSCRIKFMDIEFEVTTFRRDVEYIDHRHPITVKADTIFEDLKRRDFTINAFAMNSEYKIIDCFNGVKDLKNHIIKTIGDANTRFNEDGLRVLRALYFSSKLNFDLDDDIIKSLDNNHIKYLKQEYIKNMLEKIISLKSSKGLEYIFKYDILRTFPFWKELVKYILNYNCRKNYYALFLVLNDEFPQDVLLTKKEITNAKKIKDLVINDFDDISLFYCDKDNLEAAIYVYNCLNYDDLSISEINERYNNLKLKSIKDINFDFNILSPNKRSKTMRIVIKEILNGNIDNNFDSINEFVGCLE